jgi:phospholipid N-methyltransferase
MEYLGALSGLDRELAKVAKRIKNFSSWTSSVGAICESSQWLAKRMRNAIGETSLPILELGAGYGSVTKLLPESTVSVEREKTRFEHLKTIFPGRTILDTCALPALAHLTEPTIVVSSIPSVNNPEFEFLRDGIGRAYEAGRIAQLVTYTYFPHDPLAGIFANSEMAGIEVLNVPPAFVWKYS